MLFAFTLSSIAGSISKATYQAGDNTGTNYLNEGYYRLFYSSGSIANSNLVVYSFNELMKNNSNSPWGFYNYTFSNGSYSQLTTHGTSGEYESDYTAQSSVSSWYNNTKEWLYISDYGMIHPLITAAPTIMFTAPTDGIYKVHFSCFRDNTTGTVKQTLYIYSRFIKSTQTTCDVNNYNAHTPYGGNNSTNPATIDYFIKLKSGDKITFEDDAQTSGSNGSAATQITDLSVCSKDDAGNAYNSSSANGTGISYIDPYSIFYHAIEGKFSLKTNNDLFLTQNQAANTSSSYYYASFFNAANVLTDSKKNSISVDKYNWTFSFTPVDATDATKGVKITNENGYLCRDGYIKNGTDASTNNIFYLLTQEENGTTYAIKNANGNYWTGSFSWSSPYNIANTTTSPLYIFTLCNNVLNTTLDENTDFTVTPEPVAFLHFNRGLQNDRWNTICLPFAMTVDSINSVFGTDTKVATYTSQNGDILHFESVTGMDANTPYLIYPSKTGTTFNIYNVNIESPLNNLTVVNNNCSFMGTYANSTIPSGCYFINNNYFYTSDGSTNTIKPFRAYFKMNTSNAKQLSFNVDFNEVTSINAIENDRGLHKMYNLNGQQVSTSNSNLKTLHKGIYIFGGKKIIIK